MPPWVWHSVLHHFPSESCSQRKKQKGRGQPTIFLPFLVLSFDDFFLFNALHSESALLYNTLRERLALFYSASVQCSSRLIHCDPFSLPFFFTSAAKLAVTATLSALSLALPETRFVGASPVVQPDGGGGGGREEQIRVGVG